jgi:hypothetical protein
MGLMSRKSYKMDDIRFVEPEGKVGYRYGKAIHETEMMDYLEFIARVTSHIPDKGQVTVRYYGLYAIAHRGKVARRASRPLLCALSRKSRGASPPKAGRR